MEKRSVNAMKLYKLKKIVEKFENGEKVRGLHVPLYIMQETIRAYYILSSGRPYEFISQDIKDIFDKCGIAAKPKGIGWIVEK
jgi:hypothetical protein